MSGMSLRQKRRMFQIPKQPLRSAVAQLPLVGGMAQLHMVPLHMALALPTPRCRQGLEALARLDTRSRGMASRAHMAMGAMERQPGTWEVIPPMVSRAMVSRAQVLLARQPGTHILLRHFQRHW